jgi:hypothetical protein
VLASSPHRSRPDAGTLVSPFRTRYPATARAPGKGGQRLRIGPGERG